MIKRDIGLISLPDNICYITFLDGLNLCEYLILYPIKLEGEKILKDNIENMLKIIGEYIHESEMYQKCMVMSKEFYFVSQIQSFISEAYEHQEKADELAEKMNKGISPYAWHYNDGFIGYIDKNRISCDYVIYLDDK